MMGNAVIGLAEIIKHSGKVKGRALGSAGGVKKSVDCLSAVMSWSSTELGRVEKGIQVVSEACLNHRFNEFS
jgi:hypothetical protein